MEEGVPATETCAETLDGRCSWPTKPLAAQHWYNRTSIEQKASERMTSKGDSSPAVASMDVPPDCTEVGECMTAPF